MTNLDTKKCLALTYKTLTNCIKIFIMINDDKCIAAAVLQSAMAW